MKIIPNYKNSVAVIPSRVIDCINDATGDDMAVLIAALRDGPGFDPVLTCDELGIDEGTLFDALSFWEERGIISIRERGGRKRSERSVPFGKKNKTAPDKAEDKKKESYYVALETPSRTAEELAERLEANPNLKGWIDHLSKTLGKPLTRAQINTLVAQIDHMSLETEYVLLLSEHAKKIGCNSFHSIEKKMTEIYDKGINTYSALVEELAAIEKEHDFEGVVRKMFGIGQRSLTEKEKKIIRTWAVEWKVEEPLLKEAYEITVNATNEPSFPYANAVLENWRAHGVMTAEDAKKFQSESSGKGRKKKGQSESGTLSSFDTDDFFEAALKRSYNE